MKQRPISRFFKVKKDKPSLSGIESSSKASIKSRSSKSSTPTSLETSASREPQSAPLEPSHSEPLDSEPPASKPIKSKRSIQSQSKSKLTPLEKQIIELQAAHQDKILAIQVGYKYKFFGEDAKIVASLINIMLIPHEDERFNYCSIPDVRLHIHLKKILEYGYIVGVIKQTQSTFEAKGLFDRKITGVYTKATYMNEESEQGEIEDNGDYISAIYQHQHNYAMITVKPVTGEIIIDEFEDNELKQNLETRLTYFHPSQVLLINNYSSEPLVKLFHCNISKVEQEDGDLDLKKYLIGEFASLVEYYKLNYNESILKCIIQLMKYLNPFKLDIIFTIPSNIQPFQNLNCMILPSNVIKSLEIFENSTNHTSKGSLFWLLNHTTTKYGERLLAKWISNPLIRKELIEDRLNAIGDLSNEFNHLFDCLKNSLGMMDLEKNIIKIYYKKINRTELFKTLQKFNEINKVIKSFENEIRSIDEKCKSNDLKLIFKNLSEIFNTLDIDKFLNMISTTYGDSDNPKIQKVNYFNLKYHNWEKISAKLQDIENIKLEIGEELKNVIKIIGKPMVLVKNLNQENLIEVRNALMSKVPKDWIRINATKTLTRFRSPVLQKLNNSLLYENDQLERICDEIFQEFIELINKDYFKFHELIKNLSKFDCYLSLTAVSYQFSRPTIIDDQKINIKNFKNPIINSLTNFIANDIDISTDHNRISIITGPNMGGKSSYIKSIGILIIMSQIGCYLPCETAEIGIFESIFIRMGSIDNILKGQSTFMIEMLEMLNILNNFNDKSLILLDEVGKGTGTIDGYVIAYSILKYFALHNFKPFILFITHFPQLGELAEEFSDIGNFHMDYLVNNDEVIFLYRLVGGIVDSSYGLNVARLSGIPQEIIDNARLKSRELKLDNDLQNFFYEFSKIK